MATLFNSDLRLQGERTSSDALLRRVLAQRAAAADALYVLGDLFEAWLGDDFVPPEYQDAVDALRTLTDSGVPVYLMHGNRDFLLGEGFARRTGCRLLADPTVIDLYGRPTLLTHGDLLCSDDLAYQTLRRELRAPQWAAAFLAKPPQQRQELAQQLREQSRQEVGRKAAYLMDVNPTTVESYLHDYGVSRIIHGHTHRPAIHTLPHGGQRLTLGAWEEQASILVCDEEGCRLETS